ADDVRCPERPGSSVSAEIKCFARPERSQVWLVSTSRLLHLDRSAHHLPHVQFRPGRDVRAEADDDACFQELIEFYQTTAEKKIRSRAMCHRRLRGRDRCDFAGIKMNAMPEHSAGGEETAFLINVGVITRVHVKMMNFL